MRSTFRFDETGNQRKAISCVYFLIYSGNRVKIGCTANLMQRVYELGQSMRLVSFYPIRLIGYMEVDSNQIYKMEKRMHHKFNRLRIRGDYFTNDKTLLEFVKSNCNIECDIFNDLINTRANSGHRA